MNPQTYTLPPDIGGNGFLPGLVVPAAILLVALLATAALLYFTQIRRPRDGGDRNGRR